MSLPDGFEWKTQPYAHQRELVERTWEEPAWGLFGEMGTGKSLAVIATAAALYEAGEIAGLAIVAPKGVYRNWEGEIAAHWPLGRAPVVWTWGRKAYAGGFSRSGRRVDLNALRVFLLNVEALSTKRGASALEAWFSDWTTMLVVDESTAIKSPQAKRTKAIAALAHRAKYRRILTGSPITQSPLDLYGQLLVLQREPLGFSSFYAFRNRYAETRKRKIEVWDAKKGRKVERRFEEVTGYRRLDELQAKLSDLSTRWTKDECLDLPEKVYTRREVELTPEQRSVYRQMADKAKARLEGASLVTAPQAITQVLRLHQVVCGFVRDDEGADHEIPSRRFAALLEAIEEAGSAKIIVWAPYRHSIMEIANGLAQEYGARSVETYFGDTTSEMRGWAIERFQTDPACRFFVGNPQTAGYGLTLTAASTVIYYANSWKLEERMQSEDRAHRIGQTRAVTYVDLVAPETVDARILEALRSKHDIATEVLGDRWKEWLA